MNMERVLNITLNEKDHMYAMVEKREQYVSYLQQHEHDAQMSKTVQALILEWTNTRNALSSTIQ